MAQFEPFKPEDVVPPAPSQKPTGFINLEDDPTSRRGKEIIRQAARQSVSDIVSENVAPVLHDIIRIVKDEGPRGLVGRRLPGTPYDRFEFAKTIPENFTRSEAAAVLENPNLEAATRAVLRIQEAQERARIAGLQSPGVMVGILASTMLDIDAPLILLMGQSFGAAKLTRAVLRASQRAGLRPRAATRAASGAVGLSGGAQAGAIIGAGDQVARDTAEWVDLASIMLLTTSAGGVLGTVIPGFNRRAAQEVADEEFLRRVVRDESSAVDNLDVEQLVSTNDHLPDIGVTDPVTPKQGQKPLIIVEEGDALPNAAPVVTRGEFTAEVGSMTLPRQSTVLSPEHTATVKAYTTETTPKTEDAVSKVLDDAGSPLVEDTTVFRSYDPDIGVSGREVTSTFQNANAATATADTVQEFAGEFREVAVIKLPKGTRVIDIGPETIIKEDLVPTGKTWEVTDFHGRGSIRHVEYRPRGDGAAIIGGEKPKSLGAAATGTGGRPRRVIEDPAGPIPEAEAKVMDTSDNWVHQTDFLQTRDQVATEWWARVATNQLGGFSTQNFHDLWKGKARVGNWIGGVIFESPSGLNRGRATSSALMEMYHRRIMHRIGGDFSSFSYAWAKEQGVTWRNTGHNISKDGKRAWSRELFMEMNDRALGRKSKRSEHVVAAADRLEASGREGLEILRGRKGQRAVDGFEAETGVRDRRGYVPYRVDGFRINELLRNGVKMKDLEAALEAGYRSAGIDAAKDANAIAKAIIARARSNDFNFDTSVDTLLSGDGRQFLQESLRNSGMSDTDIKGLMQRLMGDQAEKGKESFAKRRNELDMGIEIKNDTGQKLQLVDLFDQDIDRIWQRYARQASGSAALARMGITNRAQRATVISALQAEQRALGEIVSETELMQAMFSHFDAGPVWGFSGGAINKGIGRVAATAKRLANIGLLEMLGITQLGELGAVIAMQGTASFYRRGIQPWFDKALRAKDKQLLADMSYITGEIGMDHKYYAEWLDLDDVSKQASATLNEKIAQTLSDYTSNATFIQNYMNLFNTVRSGQQKLAMMGMVDKVFRELRAGNIESFAKRAERDLGLSLDDLDTLTALMDDPKMVQWDETGKFINRVFFENWDPDFADVFGSSLTRNMNQVVQKSMAGEQDAWMHTGWGSIMTHLLTFPLAAFQKQFLRNAQHMDLQALAAVSQGMLTATLAVHIRDVVSGRDDDIAGRVKRGFNYNNLSSWIPMVWDPVVTVMGQDDWRFNQFGPTADITPVVFTQLNNLRRAPGAIINALTGADDFDYFDRQALKAIPFAGTMFLSRALNKPDGSPSPRNLSDIQDHPGVKAAIAKADAAEPSVNTLSNKRLGDIFNHPDVKAAIAASNR